MALPGMTEDVADAILDWLDTDDEPREFGARSNTTPACRRAYGTKNGPVDTVEELLLVRGVTPQLLFGADINRNMPARRARNARREQRRRARPIPPRFAAGRPISRSTAWSGTSTPTASPRSISTRATSTSSSKTSRPSAFPRSGSRSSSPIARWAPAPAHDDSRQRRHDDDRRPHHRRSIGRAEHGAAGRRRRSAASST